VNSQSYRKWWFPRQVMSNLFRIAKPIIGDHVDPNMNYLFDLSSLMTSKTLNEVIPGNPRFEPLYKIDLNEEWNDFNDINKVIFERPITTENRVAFPFLYNSRPRNAVISPYHYPQICFISSDHVEDDPFIIDGSILAILQKDLNQEILESFKLTFLPLF
jgi:pre-mRNA-processing factor 8